jgi:regulator of sigma E protease
MEIITNLLLFLSALTLLITLHEWGHYIAAKKCGVGVKQFSIGFGKPLFSRTDKHGTQWTIAPFLLGGYVRLLDQREGPVPAHLRPQSFDQQSLGKRFLVVFAGPMMNFFLGLIFIWLSMILHLEQTKTIVQTIIPKSTAAAAHIQSNDHIISLNNIATPTWSKFMLELLQHAGDRDVLPLSLSRNQRTITTTLDLKTWQLGTLKPNPLKNLGIEPIRADIPAIVATVKDNSPALKAGLMAGDVIITLDEEPIEDWHELSSLINDRINQPIHMDVMRQGNIIQLKATTGSRYASNFRKYGYLGITPPQISLAKQFKYSPNYNVLTAWGPALADTLSYSQFHFIMLGKLITGKISVQSLGGPIAIYQFSNAAMAQGIAQFSFFLAIISIMFACINLFPLPGLDGGHLAFLLYEAIRGKPLSMAAQELWTRTGIITLVLIVIHATLNDLLRLLA